MKGFRLVDNFNEVNKNIGIKLKQLRKNHEYNIDELSNKINISITDISMIENGKIDIPMSVLLKYSNYFKFSIDTLCSNESESEEVHRNDFINSLEQSCLNSGIDLNKDFELVIACAKLCASTHLYNISQNRIMISLYKRIIKYDYKEHQIDGLLEMLNLFKNTNKQIFTSDELYELFELFKDIVSVKNNKYSIDQCE